MKFNFDEEINRWGSGCLKWDEAPRADVLPLWVADMDFRVAPAITEALERRVKHGVFGYTHVTQAYYDAVQGFFARRYGWTMQREWMMYTSGVVPAVSAIIKALTQPGDGVLVQTPVYNCFFSSIRNNGCEVISSPLVRTGHTYVMDFDDLERKAALPEVKVMLLCNPHNPVGRVWTRDELQRVGEICLRHGLTVISDEIHCPLTFPGHDYIPYASVSPEMAAKAVVCLSPSKAFNIAGLQNATIVSPDAEVLARIDRAININEVCDVNPFGVEATIAAFNESEEWLRQVLVYIRENYEMMRAYCEQRLPEFPVMELEGTYLVWMDCHTLGISSAELEEQLLERAKLWLNAGTLYGPEGEGYLRWNIACPRARLKEALERFSRFVKPGDN